MSGPGLAAGRGSVRRRAARPPAPRGWEGLTLTVLKQVLGSDILGPPRLEKPLIMSPEVLRDR
jgi:hypothetical protein